MKSIRNYLFVLILPLVAPLLFHLSPRASAAQALGTVWERQIAIVWPHDGQGNPASVAQSRAVNVSVWPRNPVACAHPANFTLLVAKGNEPAQPVVGSTTRVMRPVQGGVFPSLEFNDIPVGLAAEPAAQYRFVIHGELVPTRGSFGGNVWVHAADARTVLPEPVVPTGFSASPFPEQGFDARIQIVWPHDGDGNFVPVDQASHVNLAVEVFEHGTLKTIPTDQYGNFLFSAILFAAENNDPLERVEVQPEVVDYEINGQRFPRLVFNDVPVSPGQQTHFLISVLGAGGKVVSPSTTIWAHGADPRTYFPQRDVPAQSCESE
ncbi:MAG: hypothetical protein M3220_07230 [Chloroflexota bacterium]|nr:hypothetical protein [Chloroflexota bacterium]